MAAVAILGMPSSGTFWVTYIHAAICYVTQHPETATLCQKTTDEEFADLFPEDLFIGPQDEETNEIDFGNSIHDESLPGTAETSNDKTTDHEETTNHDKDQDIFEELFI